MKGESDLKILLKQMQPLLHPNPYVFCSVPEELPPLQGIRPIAIFRESEGDTLVLQQSEAEKLKLKFDSRWAWITLSVHSSLQAVGFLAKINAALAQAGISVNVFSAYYHDHLFVPWERCFEAMEVLGRVRQNAP